MVRLLGVVARVLVELALLGEAFVRGAVVPLGDTIMLLKEGVYKALRLLALVGRPRRRRGDK